MANVIQSFPAGKGGGGGSASAVYTGTLLSAGWSNNRQTVTFNDYDGTANGIIGVPASATAAQKETYAKAGISVYSQSTNAFTLECKSVPSTDLPVILMTV